MASFTISQSYSESEELAQTQTTFSWETMWIGVTIRWKQLRFLWH